MLLGIIITSAQASGILASLPFPHRTRFTEQLKQKFKDFSRISNVFFKDENY